MRLRIVLGVLYLMLLGTCAAGLEPPALRTERASIVWGSVVPHTGEGV